MTGGASPANGVQVRDSVYWANSAALVRADEIFPLNFIDLLDLDQGRAPSACLIATVPGNLHDRPFRCESIERLDYPPPLLEVVFVANGIREPYLTSIHGSVDGLRNIGFRTRVVVHQVPRNPIVALEREIMASDADFFLLADLLAALPPDILRKAAKVHLDRNPAHPPTSPA